MPQKILNGNQVHPGPHPPESRGGQRSDDRQKKGIMGLCLLWKSGVQVLAIPPDAFPRRVTRKSCPPSAPQAVLMPSAAGRRITASNSFGKCAPASDLFGKSYAGMGLSGRSSSQMTAAICSPDMLLCYSALKPIGQIPPPWLGLRPRNVRSVPQPPRCAEGLAKAVAPRVRPRGCPSTRCR